jgi:hypothetical protein
MFAGLLVLALLVAWVRLALAWLRAEVRPAAWRIAGLVLLQPLWLGLFYLTILPPRSMVEQGRLIVLTADWNKAGNVGGHRVALPEAQAGSDVERAPDLATALRRYHPAAVTVLGRGLEARDRETDGLPLAFDAAPLPHGIIEFAPPDAVAPGAVFPVSGRVQGVRGSVELDDPAGRRVDAFALPSGGAFVLHGTARVPGRTLFSLKLRDGGGSIVETADVPLRVSAPSATRLILLGNPDPESKYLRRWATDAGLSVDARLNAGGGVSLGTPTPRFATADIIVIDDRGWAGLAIAERAAILAAVRGGAGLLLRAAGPTAHDWRPLGFQVSGGQLAPLELPKEALDATALAALRGPGDAINAGQNSAPMLTRSNVRIIAADVAPFAGLDWAGRWRTLGQGRVGIVTITDSYALALAGQKERYGALWSVLVGTVARPHGPPDIHPMSIPRVDERMSLCKLGTDRTADSGTTLQPDPAAGNCAAFWPRRAGWHTIGDRAFYVWPADQLSSLRAADTANATRALVGNAVAAFPKWIVGSRGVSWPWFAGWLLVSALLWWLERLRASGTQSNSD